MINGLKESYAVQTLCNVFEVHRSSYRYWVNRDKKMSSKRLEEVTTVKSISNESGGSAGARTIATIATGRGVELSRYRQSLDEAVPDRELPTAKTCLQEVYSGAFEYT